MGKPAKISNDLLEMINAIEDTEKAISAQLTIVGNAKRLFYEKIQKEYAIPDNCLISVNKKTKEISVNGEVLRVFIKEAKKLLVGKKKA